MEAKFIKNLIQNQRNCRYSFNFSNWMSVRRKYNLKNAEYFDYHDGYGPLSNTLTWRKTLWGTCKPYNMLSSMPLYSYMEISVLQNWTHIPVLPQALHVVVRKYIHVHFWSPNILISPNSHTGHAWLLQDCFCLDSPAQGTPPFAGRGFSHLLLLVWVPPPHSTEHSDHSV